MSRALHASRHVRHTATAGLVALLGLTFALTALAHSASAAGSSTSTADTSTTTFFDDFNGSAGSPADPNIWTYQTGAGWNGGTEQQYYRSGPSNAALTGNGTLLITAKGGAYTGPDKKSANYTSARLISKASVLYGTMSARIKMTGAPGAFPAFWGVGANYAQVGWPACGEIDAMEATNQYNNLYGSFHGPVTGGASGAYYNAGKMISPTGGLGNGWHVYAARWTPSSVTFLFDGTPYATVQRASLPANDEWALDTPENLILDVAVGGLAGTPAPPANFLATMEVDWVKVTQSSSDTAAYSAPSVGSTDAAVAPSPSPSPVVQSASPAPAPSTSAPTSSASSSAPTFGPMIIKQSNGQWYLTGSVNSTAAVKLTGSVDLTSQNVPFSFTEPAGNDYFNIKLPDARPASGQVDVALTATYLGSSLQVQRSVSWPNVPLAPASSSPAASTGSPVAGTASIRLVNGTYVLTGYVDSPVAAKITGSLVSGSATQALSTTSPAGKVYYNFKITGSRPESGRSQLSMTLSWGSGNSSPVTQSVAWPSS